MTAIATGGAAAIAAGGVAAVTTGVGAAASAGGAAVSTAGRAAATATSVTRVPQPPLSTAASLHQRETLQTGTSALDANAQAAAEATALLNDPNSERADSPISPDTAFTSTNRVII